MKREGAAGWNALLLLFGTLSAVAAGSLADVVFVNGNFHTVNERQPRAEAVAVQGERIVFVGSNADAMKAAKPGARVVNLQGRTVLPGLTDSHYHILGVGQREMSLSLEGTTSLDDLLAKVKARVSQTDPGKWVTGRGWIETFWTPQTFPTRGDLDKVAPHTPVFLTRADGHGAVANSSALKIAGISNETPSPFGGEIVKDKTSGELIGMLLDNAQKLVTKNIPAPTAAEIERAFLLGTQRSVELGWCEIQNAGSVTPEVGMIQIASRDGRVKLRIYNAVYGPGDAANRLLANGPIMIKSIIDLRRAR